MVAPVSAPVRPDPRALGLSWQDYVLKRFAFVDFPRGMRVLDLGCGSGNELEELERVGCSAFGIEPDEQALVSCRERGLRVVKAYAEHIPVKDAALDGLVCKGVIPLTDEPVALREVARVLRADAVSRLCYLGAGYYLRYLLLDPAWKFRFYGLRTLANTWLYALTGWRLPGFLGDTLYQSRRRLATYYRQNGLRLLRESPSPTFLGFPVFLYHTVQKRPN